MKKLLCIELLLLGVITLVITNCSHQPDKKATTSTYISSTPTNLQSTPISPAPTSVDVWPGSQENPPAFFEAIYPRPGSTLSLDTYTSVVELGSKDWPNIGSAENRPPNTICVALGARYLPAGKAIEARDTVVELVATYDQSRLVLGWDDLESTYVATNQANTFYSYCWQVDLVPGVYEATCEVLLSDRGPPSFQEILSYTWSFEITE